MADILWSDLWKGDYDNSTQYEVSECVSYNGSSYTCIDRPPIGTLPTDTDYWKLLAQKGDTGSTGSQGIQGIQGIQGNQGIQGETGNTGAAATIAVGSTTTGVAGSSAAVTNSGTSSAAIFDFAIPRGDKGETGDTGSQGIQGIQGIQGVKGDTGNTGSQGPEGLVWEGAYNALTAYTVDDAVSYSGSSYICIQNSTGNLPTDTDYWEVLASKGLDGEGAGDVVGPGSAVDSNFVAFDSTTGKLIKDSTSKASDFASALGADDNYVTDTEKANLHAPGSDNQDLSGLMPKTGGDFSNDITMKAGKSVALENVAGNSTLYLYNNGGSGASILQTGANLVANNIASGASVSGSNTGDQTLPVKASGAEVNTGSDDAKFVTSKAIADSKLADFIRGDGWITAGITWTYVSVDDPTGVIDITGDVRSSVIEGMRIKFTNGGNVIYGIITIVNQTLQSGNTRVTFCHEIDPTDSLALTLMANSAITANYYSMAKCPLGFPTTPDKWTTYAIDTTQRSQAATAGSYYNLGTVKLDIPIGVWNVEYHVLTQVNYGSAVNSVGVSVALSTSNNSVSDYDLLYSSLSYLATAIRKVSSRRKTLSLTSKTAYYLISECDGSAGMTLYNVNDVVSAIIKAVCAYL